MISLYHNLITEPLYNGLIFLMGLLPFLDAGIIVVIFTIIVKFILLPLSLKASKAQLEMQSTQKDLEEIKVKYKDKEEQAKKIMEYYTTKGINPFASIFILIIQLPILIGLYSIFLKSGLPQINTELLYSFVPSPSSVNMIFLGLINISQKSLVLALLAGVTTFIQVRIASGPKQSEGQSDMAKAMSLQMKYFLPIFMAFIAYTISSAVALYLITSNIFAIFQEIYIKRKYHKTPIVV
jgi:YidC/Oxa1 family membrane protein insertase